tara:strand:+ start:9467 stop:10756 length:1290 start_codon:yes stop_codon:yes gene_type:complete
MVTIFSDIISKRLRYVAQLIFEDREIEYEIINDPDVFQARDGLKLAYSDYPFEEGVFPTVNPASLLFEEDIRTHYLSRSEWEEQQVISFNGTADPLASLFYIVTCYDEYISENTDEHDRYPGSSSLVYNYGWVDKLMVERWSEAIIDFIGRFYSTKIDHGKIPFRVIPTFDIDNAYAYRLKKGVRKVLSVSRDIVRFDKARLRERKLVLKTVRKDPYDTYDYIRELVERGFDIKMFWLLGDYGTYDRNIHHEEEDFRALIKEFSSICSVGLHPSYQSNESRSKLKKEKARIEEIVEEEVNLSRQHFLKIKTPHTYEELIACGFVDDYTMGFADVVGFRAGIARPFQWFNLKKDQVTELSIHPFAYMDGTLNEYMKLSIDEAKETVKELKQEVEMYGGNFISVWHNETIGDYGKWKGWREVLETSLTSNS